MFVLLKATVKHRLLFHIFPSRFKILRELQPATGGFPSQEEIHVCFSQNMRLGIYL